MHIYSVTFRLLDHVELDRAEAIIARWIGQKALIKLSREDLWAEPARELRRQLHLDIWKSRGAATVRALRLAHPDDRVSGRQWVTEIGIDATSECPRLSLSLRTEEASALVASPVQVTRPKLISELVTACKFATYVPGADLKRMVDSHSAEAVRYVLDDGERNYALVLISALADGTYLVDCERLRQLLAGIAEVVVIPNDADTFAIGGVLGNQFRSWLGAVNVIFPLAHGFDRRTPPNRKILPHQLDEMAANGIAKESEILTIVTHRTNQLYLRQHIRPEAVHALNLQDAIQASRRHAAETGEQAQYVRLIEQEMSDLDRKLKSAEHRAAELEESLFEAEIKNDESRGEIEQLQYQTESLKNNLRAATERNGSGVDLAALRDAIYESVQGDATPEQVLQVVEAIYRGRLVVLPSAWKSAREAEDFRDSRKLFQRLVSLADEYWEGMVAGKGDGEAGKVFGDAYSARESERVETNTRARKLRTFDYRGVPLEMMRHVKIGVKDSVAETARIHFHWDAAEQVIVIGHCGRHLDHS